LKKKDTNQDETLRKNGEWRKRNTTKENKAKEDMDIEKKIREDEEKIRLVIEFEQKRKKE